MVREDAVRWNARYQQDWYASISPPRQLLLDYVDFLPRQGLIFEAASGIGANADLLIKRGLRVIGVDISELAVLRAKHAVPGLQAVIADLDFFWLPRDTFDGLLNFNYLNRALFPVYRQALRPGGILFFESLTRVMLERMPDLQSENLLECGELRQVFSDWDVLVYHEGWIASQRGALKVVASLVARKPVLEELSGKNLAV